MIGVRGQSEAVLFHCAIDGVAVACVVTRTDVGNGRCEAIGTGSIDKDAASAPLSCQVIAIFTFHVEYPRSRHAAVARLGKAVGHEGLHSLFAVNVAKAVLDAFLAYFLKEVLLGLDVGEKDFVHAGCQIAGSTCQGKLAGEAFGWSDGHGCTVEGCLQLSDIHIAGEHHLEIGLVDGQVDRAQLRNGTHNHRQLGLVGIVVAQSFLIFGCHVYHVGNDSALKTTACKRQLHCRVGGIDERDLHIGFITVDSIRDVVNKEEHACIAIIVKETFNRNQLDVLAVYCQLTVLVGEQDSLVAF